MKPRIRLPGGRWREVQVVPIDGLLADVRAGLRPLITHLFHLIPEEWPLREPPHTVARIGRSVGLSPTQVRVLENAVREMPNWYRGLPITQVADEYRDVIIEGMKAGNIVLLARRLRTRGDSVYEQTLKWLDRYGFNRRVHPIIWVKEE